MISVVWTAVERDYYIAGLSLDAVKTLVPMLVMGTKEKNAAVKSYSEHALISLLRLRDNDATLTVRIDCCFDIVL